MEYTDVKSKRLKNGILKWLQNNGKVVISEGGRHLKVKCIYNGESFPIPCSHPKIKKAMVLGFMNFVVKNGICTKEEFDRRL